MEEAAAEEEEGEKEQSWRMNGKMKVFLLYGQDYHNTKTVDPFLIQGRF